MILDSLLLRQGIVGLFCLSLNLLLMWWLIGFLEVNLLIATTICFFVLNSVGHHLSRTLVFANAKNKYKESLVRFFGVMAISLGLNLTSMYILVNRFGVPYLLASTFIAVFFFGANFVMHYFWTFRQRT